MTKISVNLKFILERVENISEKEENATDKHFLFLQKSFQKGFLLKGRSKSGMCVKL